VRPHSPNEHCPISEVGLRVLLQGLAVDPSLTSPPALAPTADITLYITKLPELPRRFERLVESHSSCDMGSLLQYFARRCSRLAHGASVYRRKPSGCRFAPFQLRVELELTLILHYTNSTLGVSTITSNDDLHGL